MPVQSASSEKKISDREKYAKVIGPLTKELASHEGRCSWMYLDSAGHLTIGIGHLVARHGSTKPVVQKAIDVIWKYGFDFVKRPAAPELGPVGRSVTPGVLKNASTSPWFALLLSSRTGEASGSPTLVPGITGLSLARLDSWIRPLPGLEPSYSYSRLSPVSQSAVVDEAMTILSMGIHYKDKKGKQHTYGAGHYQSANSFALSENGIDELLADDALNKGVLAAKSFFTGFDKFPVSAQIGLSDLAFQGLGFKDDDQKSAMKSFKVAVVAQDWQKAALLAPRLLACIIAGPTRTAWRQKQLLAALPK